MTVKSEIEGLLTEINLYLAEAEAAAQNGNMLLAESAVFKAREKLDRISTAATKISN